MESPAGRAISFERGSSTAAAGAAVVAGGERQRLPSVTLKLAMDRNGAVDDMSEGPKRFTSQESLDAGERTGQPHDTRNVRAGGGGGRDRGVSVLTHVRRPGTISGKKVSQVLCAGPIFLRQALQATVGGSAAEWHEGRRGGAAAEARARGRGGQTVGVLSGTNVLVRRAPLFFASDSRALTEAWGSDGYGTPSTVPTSI